MSAWLTADEVAELTGRVRHKVQARKLAELGVPFRLSAQGRPLVERAAVLTAEPKPAQTIAPRWDRLRRAA